MAIDTLYRNDYTGDGTTNEFPFTFAAYSSSHLKAIVTDEDGNQTELTLDTHFSVFFDAAFPSTGTLTLLSGIWLDASGYLESGNSLSIELDPAFEQTVVFGNQSQLNRAVIEKAADMATMLSRRAMSHSRRAIRIQEGLNLSDYDLVLPKPEAGKAIGWDVLGTSLENKPTSAVSFQGDSGDITFAQAAVGAVSRTVLSKLREWVSIADFGASTGASASVNAAKIQAALDTGKRVFVPEGTFNYNTQIFPSSHGQQIFGCGRRMSALNFTGSGYAFAFKSKSRCVIHDLEISTADEGIDFNIVVATLANCDSNVIERCLIQGPGRGATSSTSTRKGVIFRRMNLTVTPNLTVYFNVIRDCMIQDFDIGVYFDAPTSNPTAGGNFNNCFNIHMERFWTGYHLNSVETVIHGGQFNAASGNSSVDYVLGYKFSNGAVYNTVFPAVGEPGLFAKAYEFDLGTSYNTFIPLAAFNYPLGGTDLGDFNTISGVLKTQSRRFTALTENHYYSIPLNLAASTNYTAAVATVHWASHSANMNAASAGCAQIGVFRTTAVDAWALGNNQRETGAAVRFVGIKVAGTIASLVFFVLNNGGGTSTNQLDVTVQGVDSSLAIAQGATATDEGTSDPSTVSCTNTVAASGTYTPTLTNVANAGTLVAHAVQWSRVGDTVTGSIGFEVNPDTTATLTRIGISLPVASNLSDTYQLCGSGGSDNLAGEEAFIVLGDAANNRAELRFICVDAGNRLCFGTFQYKVI